MFSGLQQNFDITKARPELGFSLAPAQEAVTAALHYLNQHQNRLRP